ncbi:pyridoxal phosphate-dependent aminotransferase [Halobellus marinus]|uniref:pyridoxal phosphate-dependent aminotransferase n=1 Tax=Halobellus TaxID=1073986 RepID=UPI0028AE50B0|nr:pyridoxal phosphate-dependent aminotransferase [Halobellus sp. DFY28]
MNDSGDSRRGTGDDTGEADDAYDEPLFQRVIGYAAAADRDVVDMVSGHPDWEPPAPLREGLREYADSDPPEFQYQPSEGLSVLRESIAARRNVDESRLIVTNGAGEANYLAMARAMERDAGAEFVVTDPVYPYYPARARMLDGTTTRVPAREDGHLDVPAIRAAVSADTAAVVLNNPNNPTGAVYDPAAVEEIAEVTATHDALLIVDEVYDHFDFTGRFESALTLDHDHVVVTASFSKSLGITGFRVGYAVFPDDLVEEAGTRHMLVNLTGSRPAQVAVAKALQETPPSYYESIRTTLRERIDDFTTALDAAGADYTTPEGAFYVLARFEGFPGTLSNVERLIDEAGVAGMPGEAFGSAYDEWIRFTLCTDRTTEAADRLAAYFEDR